MDARQIAFQTLLNGNVQYRVPLFQRTYDWSEAQWKQLWDDLMRIYAMDEPQKHFVGSIVTHPIPVVAGDTVKYSVIDGQQRMTTLLILLSVIRDWAERDQENYPKLADEIQKTCLTNEFAKQSHEKTKLMPTRRDQESFLTVIHGGVPPDISQVGSAWKYLDSALRSGDLDNNAIDLERLKTCIVHQLDMVSITLDSDDNPNRIFESLNYTGLSLDAADLIRNYLFMNINDANKQDDAYDKYWYPMQEKLDWRQEFFFWRYLMIDGSLPKRERDAIFNRVKDSIGPAPEDETIINALERFHRFSGYYLEVVAPQKFGSNKSISGRISRLILWGFEIAYSFLMKAIAHIDSGHISPEALMKVIDMIESFVVRRHVCGYSQAGLRRLFARMSAEVDFGDSGMFVESSRNHLPRSGWPDDKRFTERLLQHRIYVPSRQGRARLILNSLERSFEHEEAPNPAGDNITIEHIMPQTLTREWRDALGPDSVEIHDRLVHTLGNLTLTGYNSPLSNKTFNEKKAILDESNFALNSSLKKLDIWNADAIEHRGRDLADRAVKIWPR